MPSTIVRGHQPWDFLLPACWEGQILLMMPGFNVSTQCHKAFTQEQSKDDAWQGLRSSSGSPGSEGAPRNTASVPSSCAWR